MKAKDYAAKFNANPCIESIQEVGTAFLAELKAIILERHARVDSAVLAVFKEQDQKWQAFARLTNGMIKQEGFRILVREFYPMVHQYLHW